MAVFGLGAVGLAVIQAAKLQKAKRIFAVRSHYIDLWLLFRCPPRVCLLACLLACGATTHPPLPLRQVDVNPKKFDMAVSLGATDCLNPQDFPDKPIQQVGG